MDGETEISPALQAAFDQLEETLARIERKLEESLVEGRAFEATLKALERLPRRPN